MCLKINWWELTECGEELSGENRPYAYYRGLLAGMHLIGAKMMIINILHARKYR